MEKSEKYDSEITRNLIILYGFFFVLLGSLLNVSVQLASWDYVTRLIIYSYCWLVGVSAIGVGFGITLMLEKVHVVAKGSIFLLTAIVPVFYVVVEGRLLLHDDFLNQIIGIILFMAFVTLLYFYIKWLKIKEKNSNS